MIRNMFLCIIILALCLFVVDNFTIAVDVVVSESDSDNGMRVVIEKSLWVMQFNLNQEFADMHHVELRVYADNQYDGSYVGNCYVTGKLAIVFLDKRYEDFLGGGGDIYYVGGAFDTAIADNIFKDHPNVDVPSEGYGWGRIRGYSDSENDYVELEEETSSQINFSSDSSDITPNCDECEDADPECPNAGNRHFSIGRRNPEITPTDPMKTPSPGIAYGLKVDTGEPY